MPRRISPSAYGSIMVPRILFVHVNEIDWIEAADYYVCLQMWALSLLCCARPSRSLSRTLDPGKLVRIHRSVIVNVEQVSEIFREGQSEVSVVLKSGQRLRMSKAGL